MSWKNTQRFFCFVFHAGGRSFVLCIEFIDCVFRSVVYFQINCLHPACSSLGLGQISAIVCMAQVTVLCRALVKTKCGCILDK